MYEKINAQITYRNKESFIDKVLTLYHWKYETPASLKEFLENLDILLDKLEVLKMNVEDMIQFKEKEGAE